MMAAVTEEQRRFLCRYHHEEHPDWSCRRIATLLGCKKDYVITWWNRLNTKNRKRGRTATSFKVDDGVKRKVRHLMVGTKKGAGGACLRKASVRETSKILKREGVNMCKTTVHDINSEHHTYLVRVKKVRLDDGFAARRWKWAESVLHWTFDDWSRLLNTDSSPFYVSFASNRKNDGVWCEDDQDPPPMPSDKYSLKTEVYCGVSRRGIAGPVFIDSPDRVNAQNYTERVLPVLAFAIDDRQTATNNPRTTKLFDRHNWVYQHDLARPHIAKKTLSALDEHKIGYWPPDETPPRLFEWPI